MRSPTCHAPPLASTLARLYQSPQLSLARVGTWLARVSRLSKLYETVELSVTSKATGTPSTSVGSSARPSAGAATAPSNTKVAHHFAAVPRILGLSERGIDERPEYRRLVAE